MPTHQAAATLPATAGMAAAGSTRFNHEAQAFEYRRKMQAREDSRLTAELALAGSSSAVLRVEADWDALRPWRGWEPKRKVVGEPA